MIRLDRSRGCVTPTSRFQPGGCVRVRPSCSPTAQRQPSWEQSETAEEDVRVGIAIDHGGFALKRGLVNQLRAAEHEVIDFGAHNLSQGGDYPDFVVPLAQALALGKVDRGVAVCGSGVGASVCANKV